MYEKIFKAYDIRGIYPAEINEKAVCDIVKAYAAVVKPHTVAVGQDVRKSGKSLKKVAIDALIDMGVDVIDIGVVTTDMLYFAVAEYGLDGGLSITASHNPAEYNGIKMVREEAKPISIDSGLREIQDIAGKKEFSHVLAIGKVEEKAILDDYIQKLFEIVDTDKIKPMKVVVNPNFGAAIPVVEKIAEKLKLKLVKLNFDENGLFPKGRPDPSLAENQEETAELVRFSGANLGVAWDADADRCFFFDEKGEFISGYYTTAILAKLMLKGHKNQAVIQDPRLVWATRDVILEAGGAPIMNKVGHSFIKERMRQEEAVFAGEISGHYYFKDYYYCDNGMIPFLLMLQHLSETSQALSTMVQPYREKYPNSGEINFEVNDTDRVMSEIIKKYSDGELDQTDGISVSYDEWRFNVRSSNTEPLLRLNIEATDQKILDEKVSEIKDLINR